MPPKAIILPLDDDQQDAVDPLLDRARAAAAAGQPGAVLAQVFGSQMAVFWLSAEQTRQLQAILGQPVGATTNGPPRPRPAPRYGFDA